MENDISLYKHHSYAACISEGYNFLAKHLLPVSKAMFPYYTAASLFAVLSFVFAAKIAIEVQIGGTIEQEEIIYTYLFYLLFAVMSVIATGRLFLLFRRLTGAEPALPEESRGKRFSVWRNTLKRTLQLAWLSLPYTVWGVIYSCPGFSPTAFLQDATSGLDTPYKVLVFFCIALVLVLALVFITPLFYTFYCRMMRPTFIDGSTEEGKAQTEAFCFKTAYRQGFRHKGKTLGVLLLSGFLVSIASIVFMLPCIVSSEAYLSCIEGQINYGDTEDIPVEAYIYMLAVATMALTLVQIFAVTLQASMLYLFGDIFSDNEESRNKK